MVCVLILTMDDIIIIIGVLLRLEKVQNKGVGKCLVRISWHYFAIFMSLL